MDIARPNVAKEKRRKRIIYATIAGVVLIGITVALGRLKPAAPSMPKNLVWMGEVKRGPMVRQVRGLGTLVPEEIRWIAARTQGRVDKIVIRPGAPVEPGTLILELSNPDVVSAAANAKSQLLAAEAQLAGLRVTLESGLLQAEAAAAQAKSNYEQARLRAEVDEDLFKDGLVAAVQLKLTQGTAAQAAINNEIEQKRYAFAQQSIKPQLAVQEAEVERLASLSRLRNEELEALQVRATMSGVLSALGTPNLPIEVGAQVQPGNNIARVADPLKLKAEVRIAETQAKDIAIGQLASIDTRNGIVEGRVSRIDPAVQNGTVTVDVTIVNALPRGSRPDLSVDGTIELERLDDVIYVGRPAFGQEKSTVGIFKANGSTQTATEASRIQVQFGRSSVNTIEVVSGLQPGDWVILSDMSQYDSNERVKLD
ncbi:multidrug resistance protein MdtN [Lacunisphaera limnophila]|uniref:Multidrug resistance protein MdtN n=1 Tax=Lacunisphaera limnophila TaxID=1838286 RepID=A0A1D8AXD6_9BACT|nr:efflux RND transporter periplasmic adaptor subunit [Lacunisphaera limnophila]AOS45541.1 multidrug resistance protein MdtN [Lacunisphaera limnophila]